MMRRLTLGVLMAAVTVSCSGDVSALQPIASGTYRLASVTGRGAAEGSITLSASGAAERRVRYLDARGVLSAEYVSTGTYRHVAKDSVLFELSEGLTSSYILFATAGVSGNTLTFEFFDPADGPKIVETYRRE
ncbi:MAG: hypothetical protein ABI852_19755 [Gemmatimonadaceae bacterium]